MRYYRKKEIKEKFQLLKETHQYIKAIMCQNQDIVPVLADCQTLAIEIGGEIEECQGEGCKAIVLLEKYCEALYHIAQRKYPGLPEKMAESTEKELEESLAPAWESFQKDIPEERVVVFLPYMASMWDSMESVWKRLKGEEHTRCVVVPLPFYVKNGKKKAEFRYEGEKFPKELEIVNYEKVLQGDFYADIAIYHNPYDDVNKLTQIDERFFSSQLHNYANTLVYMPYYVLTGEPDVSFIVLPGVKNADYVVLQDEKMVEAFRYWHPKEAKKFLAFESPKITKVKEMNALPKEELSIPEEWKEKIRGKKVLFYNTHLAGLMNEELDFIGKLKSVFDTMRKQENVILWWRPHPLTETVRFQISPERYQEYEDLIRWYKEEDFGIYDDTPNLHEAIAAADGFYGDQSSVVKLFQAAGKPVMVQRNLRDGRGLWWRIFEDCCYHKDCIYYTAHSYNGLFCLDTKTEQIDFLGPIPDEKLSGFRLYSKILPWGENKLVLVPYNAAEAAVYDLNTGKFEKYSLPIREYGKFLDACILDDRLYLLPWYCSSAYQINLTTKEIRVIDEITKICKELSENQLKIAQVNLFNRVLYFTLIDSDMLFAYHIDTGKVGRWRLNQNGKRFFSCVAVGKGVFCIGMHESYAVYFQPDQEIVHEFYFEDIFSFKEKTFSLQNVKKDVVYVTPVYTNILLAFDINTGKVKKIPTEDKEKNKFYGNIKILDDQLAILPVYPDKILQFENGRQIIVKEEYFAEQIFTKAIEEGEMVEETISWDFEKHLAHLNGK